MEDLKLFPQEVHTGTKVLFFNLGENESKTAFSNMQQLREKGISCELYHENTKMDKQFKYAEKKNIPYVVIIGGNELKENVCNLKDLRSGEQKKISLAELTGYSF
jgi:histidyl-tRNA synthetase